MQNSYFVHVMDKVGITMLLRGLLRCWPLFGFLCTFTYLVYVEQAEDDMNRQAAGV